jgi:hypothetical protein
MHHLFLTFLFGKTNHELLPFKGTKDPGLCYNIGTECGGVDGREFLQPAIELILDEQDL